MTDYAVVVGIARYPGLSAEGVAPDLDGPDNDAQAVHDWLVSPDGGGLLAENVRLLRTGNFEPLTPTEPQPTMDRIRTEMLWLEEQTRSAPGGRLILYFSGHGFAPELEEGALFTAESTHRSPSYVYAHAWLRWFRKAQRFRQSVLWMDCCMDYQHSIPTNEVLMRAEVGTGMPGPAFVALAAQTKSALECRMPDGKVHGVFTWTLLAGLRGGAANDRGQITGESLRTFLHNVMPEFLPDSVRRAGSVDLQPFVRADPGVVFRRMDGPPRYRVRLTTQPAAVGGRLRIWGGRPHANVIDETLTATAWSGELERGLYVAELPGFQQGFQVTGAGDVNVAVTQPGPPVLAPRGDRRLELAVTTDNPAASITVTDHAFERVFSGTGDLRERDKPGVYKVRVAIGRDIALVSDEVVLLDRDLHLRPVTGKQVPSPAPIGAHTHRSHASPFSAAARRVAAFARPATDRAVISIISRYPTTPDSRPNGPLPHPMAGLELIDLNGDAVTDLSRDCKVDRRGGNPVAVWDDEVPAGAYILRRILPDGRMIDGCVLAHGDWVTQMAIQRAATGNVGAISDAAVFMRRPMTAGTWSADQDAAIEAARLALAQGRNLFGDGRGAHLRELLLRTYDDPIAGMIGCHLLLRAIDAGGSDPALEDHYDGAVQRLRDMVGTAHPDVEALSLRCGSVEQRATRPFTVPPMFSHSWYLVAAASYAQPELVPRELWRRVHAAASLGPFFVWAADPDTRAAHERLQVQFMIEHAGPQAHLGAGTAANDKSAPVLPDTALRAAKRSNVPAVGATALWEAGWSSEPA